MLRSALVAAFSVVVALGVLSGFSDAKDDVRANTSWPTASVAAEAAGTTSGTGSVTDGAGS